MSGTLGTAEPVMRLEDLDFELPQERIAQRPLPARDACRLLCVHRNRPGRWSERSFRELPHLLRAGDVLVRNATRVLPARLEALKEGTGARCEVLLLEPETAEAWWALVRPARRLPVGTRLRLADGTVIVVRAAAGDGRRLLGGAPGTDLASTARRCGLMPLPPYICRPADGADAADYQTVYARTEGSVAAPTAGLHFTPELLTTIADRGVTIVDLVLHVGLGTFQPIRDADPLRHRMHWERFEIEAAQIERIDAARSRGGRVVAVGTTVVRALESIAAWERSAAGDDVEITTSGANLRGRTRIFLHPPHDFRRVDAMITNFHLPRSTLLLLVDAFAGRETIRAAYRHAVENLYRFFSYGDAMWIE